MNLKIPDTVKQRTRFQSGSQPPGGNEVLPKALSEIARFSNVNDSLEPVLHKVHARLMRHVTQFLIRIRLFASGCDLHRTQNTPHAQCRPATPPPPFFRCRKSML